MTEKNRKWQKAGGGGLQDKNKKAHGITNQHKTAHSITNKHRKAHGMTNKHRKAHGMTNKHRKAHGSQSPLANRGDTDIDNDKVRGVVYFFKTS